MTVAGRLSPDARNPLPAARKPASRCPLESTAQERRHEHHRRHVDIATVRDRRLERDREDECRHTRIKDE